jgi:hypothetical protein
MAEALRLAGRIAAFGLSDDERETQPFRIPREDWPSFLATLVSERLTGLAVAANAADELRLTGGQRRALRDRHEEVTFHVLRLEARLLSLTRILAQAGIETIVLKGSALAHAFYPDPSWRPFADIDLLVRAQDWERTCSLLAAIGLRRSLPEPRPGFERFRYAALHRTPDGLEVDLHRTLVLGAFGLWMDPEELFRRNTSFALGDAVLRRLDDTALLLHACVHASLGRRHPLLRPLRDLAQVASLADPDWELIADWARRWRAGSVIQRAFALAQDTLRTELRKDMGVFLSWTPTWRERRALRAYTTSRRRRGAIALSTVGAIPDLRGKATYVRALLVPDRAFLRARAGDAERPLLWRRWLIPVRWLVRRRPQWVARALESHRLRRQQDPSAVN